MNRAVIFGVSDFGIALSKKICTKYEIVAFADNDPKKQGMIINGIPVVNPDFISDNNIDKIFMGTNSFLSQNPIKNQLQKMGIPEEAICCGHVSKKSVDTIKNIFLKQHDIFHGCNYKGFLNYNIIMLLLGVEEYFGHNSYGMEICRKYRSHVSPVENETSEEYISNFEKLIQNFDGNFSEKDSGIILNRNGRMIDGSHRMAICLYKGCNQVPVIVMNTSFEIIRDWDWILNSEIFSNTEVNIIKQKYTDIINNINRI